MTIPEADDKGKTAPIELPIPAAPPPAEPEPVPAPPEPEPAPRDVQTPAAPHSVVEPAPAIARPASAQEREVLFIPLAVNIGDGFKFGCGFFLAAVLVMLVGFVLLAVLFVLTGVFGLNIPITR